MQAVKKILSNIYPALFWTIIIFILLALPGNMLPSESNFRIPNFDKYIHVSIFCVFVVLWSFYYATKPEKNIKTGRFVFIIFIAACLYGIAMEYVQKYFIPFRDFDVYDILADITGAAIGFIISALSLSDRQKNKPL